jgi:hypothetical protein
VRHLRGAVEAVEANFFAFVAGRIVLAHPFDEFAACRKFAEIVAKAAFLDGFVVWNARRTADILVHQTPAGKTAFDRDRREAVRFDEAFEHAIAQHEEFLAAVHRFAQAEQFDFEAKCGHYSIDGAVQTDS